MKKVIAPLFLLAVLWAGAASAQRTMKPAEERAANTTEWMKTNLKLNEDQTAKAQDINLKYARRMDELQNSSDNRSVKITTLKKEMDAKDAELKQVFTDEQYKSYEARKAEMKTNFRAEMKKRKAER
jgi:hypothetical protein